MESTFSPEIPLTIMCMQMDEPQYTAKFLKTVRAGAHPEAEYIVVDNGSKEENYMYLLRTIDEMQIKCIVIRNRVNKGFSGGINQGLKYAKGRYFLFSNNDTEWPSVWYQPMVRALNSQPNVKAIFPTYSSGMSPGKRGGPGDAFIVPTRWVRAGMPSMVSCFAETVTWRDRLGGMSEDYYPISGEDADFICQVWDRGYDIAIDERVFVLHVGKGTSKNFPNQKQIWEDMAHKFMQKWGSKLKALPKKKEPFPVPTVMGG